MRAAAGLLLLSAAEAITPVVQLRHHILHPRKTVASPPVGESPKQGLLTQPLNHDDPSQGTFQQRYWTRDDWWCGNSSCPVFLCTGGEGPGDMNLALTNSSVHCGIMLALARETGALLVALEHRFYGKSLPKTGRTLANLRHLTSAQNVADLPALHKQIAADFAGAGSARWITFGGSYPGMMASFLRLKHPELIYASISSSAPVQAQFDFQGYLGVVHNDLADASIGGSAQCLKTVQEGHAVIAKELATEEGQRKVAADFKLCNASALSNAGNRADFAGFGVFSFDWQGNNPACTDELCSLAKICSFLDKAAGDSRAKVLDLALTLRGGSCLDVDHDASNEQMAQMVAQGDATDNSWPISWYWQTCNEWGFFQSCEVGSTCPFAQGVSPATIVADACPKVFKVPFDQVRKNIDASNVRFGGRHPQGSRVMYVNGGEDPWHALGVLPPGLPNFPAYLAPGVSHHFWTHPPRSTDAPADVAAREAVKKQVLAWLQ
eukprot:TRINITY_DN35382_c0_g1_i1.p1 TRINITY_DN35382_c0_g1~~TRINITY_DN35382_c0_g1_i1.p1  ORF type:complete len:493 (+),score=163.31 TRINITY_DN35382_c0_g1_i1:64-1542(+)